jgi:hypothetical protein
MWTQRGTLHTVAAADMRWMLSVTGERMLQADARRLRELELDAETLVRAERVVAKALGGGGRLTRAEAFARCEAAGIATDGQRGYHLLFVLAMRGVIVWGPVVHRDGFEPREQHLVLVDEWIPDTAEPDDPPAELFVRYVEGHGPAGVRDFAWWSGLTLGQARQAAEAGAARVRVVADEPEPLYVSASAPRSSSGAPATIALPTFEEFYISYADRDPVCAPAGRVRVGPGANGMVRPVILHEGEVVGTWKPPALAQRATGKASFELFDGSPAAPADAEAAVARAMAALRG